MALFRGATELKKFYIGGTEYKKLFRGATEIFSAANVVTVTLPHSVANVFGGNGGVSWLGDGHRTSWPELGNEFSTDGRSSIYLAALIINRTSPAGLIRLRLASARRGQAVATGPDFSSQMETSGTITLAHSTGSVVLTGIGDSTEPYQWTPSNSAAIVTWVTRVIQAANRSITATFNDDP